MDIGDDKRSSPAGKKGGKKVDVESYFDNQEHPTDKELKAFRSDCLVLSSCTDAKALEQMIMKIKLLSNKTMANCAVDVILESGLTSQIAKMIHTSIHSTSMVVSGGMLKYLLGVLSNLAVSNRLVVSVQQAGGFDIAVSMMKIGVEVGTCLRLLVNLATDFPQLFNLQCVEFIYEACVKLVGANRYEDSKDVAYSIRILADYLSKMDKSVHAVAHRFIPLLTTLLHRHRKIPFAIAAMAQLTRCNHLSAAIDKTLREQKELLTTVLERGDNASDDMSSGYAWSISSLIATFATSYDSKFTSEMIERKTFAPLLRKLLKYKPCENAVGNILSNLVCDGEDRRKWVLDNGFLPKEFDDSWSGCVMKEKLWLLINFYSPRWFNDVELSSLTAYPGGARIIAQLLDANDKVKFADDDLINSSNKLLASIMALTAETNTAYTLFL